MAFKWSEVHSQLYLVHQEKWRLNGSEGSVLQHLDMRDGHSTHLRITYWKMNPTALGNQVIQIHDSSCEAQRDTYAHGTQLIAVAGGMSPVPLKITGLQHDEPLEQASVNRYHLQAASLVSFVRMEEKDSTHLTYLKRLLGYLLLISHGMAGAMAPIKKKKTRA